MCSSSPPKPKPPAPPPPPPPVLEQAAPVQSKDLGITDAVRKKAGGTKKYSSASASLGNTGGPSASKPGLG